MTNYTKTILAVSVHLDSENPVFGENSLHVSLDDDAGGMYVKLTQCNDDIAPGEVKLDFDQLDLIKQVVDELRAQPTVV